MEYKVSDYGYKIKMCCASCAHVTISDKNVRKCGLDKSSKRLTDVCIGWQVKPKLMNAGKGTGVIHDKEEIIKSQDEKLKKGLLKINYTKLKMDGEMRGSK